MPISINKIIKMSMLIFFLSGVNNAYSMLEENMEEQKEILISKGIKPPEGVKRETSSKSRLNLKKENLKVDEHGRFYYGSSLSELGPLNASPTPVYRDTHKVVFTTTFNEVK